MPCLSPIRAAPYLAVVLVAMLATPALGGAIIYHSKPENAYGWCTGNRASRAHRCAKRYCIEAGGSKCEAVVECANGWGAIALAQKPGRGIAAVCGEATAFNARFWALTNCSIVVNTLCRTDSTFDRRGTAMRPESNRNFDRTLYAQFLLQGRGYRLGRADGVAGASTTAAVAKFQSRIGLPPDGEVTDEVFERLLDAAGGIGRHLAQSKSFLVKLWKEEEQKRAFHGYTFALAPGPAMTFTEELKTLSPERRLVRLAVMIRYVGMECTIPARNAVSLSSNRWSITCDQRAYTLEMTPKGAKISYSLARNTEDAKNANDVKDNKDPGDAGAARVSAVAAVMAKYAANWHPNAVKTDLDFLRMVLPNKQNCLAIEATNPVLAGAASAGAKLKEAYAAIDRKVAGLPAAAKPTGLSLERYRRKTYFDAAACGDHARLKGKNWAALIHAAVAAKIKPGWGLYPSILLSSGELGVVDMASVRQYAERAKTDPNAEWARKVLSVMSPVGSGDCDAPLSKPHDIIAGCTQVLRNSRADARNRAAAHHKRGTAYAKVGETANALSDYGEAIRLTPRYAPSYYNRAKAYRSKRNFDRAIADYDQAIRLNPRYADAYNGRGIAHHMKGDKDAAIADYGRAIELNPKLASAYYNRGLAHRSKRDLDHAIADYDRAIELNPRYARAYNGRGTAHRMKGDKDAAIADFRKALSIDKSYKAARENLRKLGVDP